MTRSTQIYFIYFIYAVLATVGLLSLETTNGISIILGVITPDLLSKFSRKRDSQALYIPIVAISTLSGAVLLSAIQYPELTTSLSLYVFALSMRVLITMNTSTGVRFYERTHFGWTQIRLTKIRDLTLKWSCCCLTIALIADTVIPRSVAQSVELVALFQKHGVL